MSRRILVVDDEPLKRVTLQIELTEHGYEVLEAADAEAARRLLDGDPFDVVVSDVRMPGLSGLDLLTYIKQLHPQTQVILMTAYATVDMAVLAIKRGAYDYITKPFTTADLLTKLDRLFAARDALPGLQGVESFGRLVARGQQMRRVFELARAAAPTDRPILVCGESGTGKSLLVEEIHARSARADRPLVRCSCGGRSLPALRAELFGTDDVLVPAGAALDHEHRPEPTREHGRPAVEECRVEVAMSCIEAAAGGTLVVEEVDALSLELQAGLIQSCNLTGRPGGGPADSGELPDIRLICTTRVDLAERVQSGQFRADLFYPLSVVTLNLPPLRERPEDIPLLARLLVDQRATALSYTPAGLHPGVMDELVRYSWPGNVRELEHVIDRALALAGRADFGVEHVLPLGTAGTDPQIHTAFDPGDPSRLSLTETVADIERRMILLALRQSDSNQARAAQRLGIPRTTLRDKMGKHGIPTG